LASNNNILSHIVRMAEQFRRVEEIREMIKSDYKEQQKEE
jgi:hypothetical protein